jgi:putative two-component system response regulator
MILSEILKDSYETIEVESGIAALEYLKNTEELPEAVLLDIIMPGMDGFTALSMIRSNPRTESIPVLIITAIDADTNESRGLHEGANDFISKPFNPDVVKARVDNHIQLSRYRRDLEHMLDAKTAELVTMHERTLETLATIIEYRSLESGTHIRRTQELTRVIIQNMLKRANYNHQLTKQKYHSMINAVALHDIGKVGIPDNVLLKPGKLTAEEFDIIKTHCNIGANIIETIAAGFSDDNLFLTHCKDICRHHHERWDGTGYPDGLRGSEIPLSARIVSVVDVYDAIVNPRCYKPAMPYSEALTLIKNGSGSQFDPFIVGILFEVSHEFERIEREMSDVIGKAEPCMLT